MNHHGGSNYFQAQERSMDNLTVFVVEDDRFYRQGLVELLGRYSPFEVAGQADNGIDAVRLARDLQPDVVLLDQSLPFLSWQEAASTIHVVSKNSKILILSLNDHREYVIAAFGAGASGYLVKQAIDADSLIGAIESVSRGEDGITIGVERREASAMI